MTLYYFIGRLLSFPASIGLTFFSLLTGTDRVRVVVFNESGELLLLKTWLGGNKWALPGGGVHRRENESSAARRELAEETGISVPDSSLTYLFSLRSALHDEKVFQLQTTKSSLPIQLPRSYEVEEAKWFSLDALPKTDALTKQILSRMEKTG